MTDRPSQVRDRAETRAAQTADKATDAAAVWAQVEAERQALDDRTARLRAARLAREAKG